jgi:hypothetical protein
MAYRLGGTVSPRNQVLTVIIALGTVIVVGTALFLVYEVLGYVPRWLIGVVGISVFLFFMKMTVILRKDVKYDDD